MSSLRLFENQHIRSHWDTERELWYFSIVDVVAVLTGSANSRKYWSVLKTRLKKEGSQLATNCSQLKMTSAEGNETVTNCHGLKMNAADGKSRLTDVADIEQLLRRNQSISPPKV